MTDREAADPCGLHDFWCDEPKCAGPCNCHLTDPAFTCPWLTNPDRANSQPADREAAVQQVAETRSKRWHAEHAGTTFSLGWFLSPALIEAEDWWPLIVQAREDGERAGVARTVQAIEAYGREKAPRPSVAGAVVLTVSFAADLARGVQQPDGKERTDGQ